MQTLAAAIEAARSKPRKYRNKPVTVDGVRFDSQREYARHCELDLLQRAGAIRHLHRQVTFPLVVNYTKIGSVRPDWTYTDSDGVKVAEDLKGAGQTPSHRVRWKLAQALYPEWRWKLTK